MKIMGRLAQALLFVAVWLPSSDAACQLPVPKGLIQTPYPDVRKAFNMGYKLTAEANVMPDVSEETLCSSIRAKSTYHATEYYDVPNKQGFIDTYLNGEQYTVYYNHRTNEAFFYSGAYSSIPAQTLQSS
ncbi:hypothetical protein MRX96_042378 [Rhipicephalus microplus]